MLVIVLTLPYPISANRYWRPVPIGNHITIVPTKEAKAYKREVGHLARLAGILQPIRGRVRVHIDLYPHRPQDWKTRQRKLGESWDDSVRCIDLDNARKVLYDALKHVAFEDDSRIWSDSARRMEPDESGERVVVVIEAIAVKVAQQGLALPEPEAEAEVF